MDILLQPPTQFTAPVIPGAGRGKGMNIPTINLDTTRVPKDLSHGIYAGWAEWEHTRAMAAIHYGPRLAFKDSVSFEVHVLDLKIDAPPAELTVTLIAGLREIQDFASKEALLEAIEADIERTRAILGAL